MKITVNNEILDVVEASTLEVILNSLKLDTNAVAAAVNQKIIPQNNWKYHILREDDVVLVITPTAGG